MKKLILSLALLLASPVFADEVDLPKLSVIPFSQLGPAAALPLNMTVPSDYVWSKRFVEKFGAVVLCALSDEAVISDGGDFSKTTKAVITLRPSASDFFDTNTKSFSFEKTLELDATKMGARNLQFEKRDVRGLPVFAATFELKDRKIYSLAFASGSQIYRLSYNAKGKQRAYDDALWKALVDGL